MKKSNDFVFRKCNLYSNVRISLLFRYALHKVYFNDLFGNCQAQENVPVYNLKAKQLS